MDRFSIILPVLNGGEYLKYCVRSILCQTVNEFDLLLLDNCSDDGTVEWVSSLKDKRIKIFKSESRLSIEENWGRISRVSKNEFMTMIGHDDLLAPDYLEVMESLISIHPSATLYQTHYNYIDKDGKVTRNCLPMDEIQKGYEFLACQMNQTINSTGTGYMMRSADFDALGGMPSNYPNLIFSDYELWIRLSKKNYKATALKQCFYYREHLSISRITNGELYLTAFEEYVKFMVELKNNDPDFKLIIERYGHKMLLYFCESLSHRLLKTPKEHRSMKVLDLVEKFKIYAKWLIPDQAFAPLTISRINYALILDKTAITRSAFKMANKFMGR